MDDVIAANLLGEINRIKEAKTGIRNAIIANGVEVAEDVLLSEYPAFIEQLGGSGGTALYTCSETSTVTCLNVTRGYCSVIEYEDGGAQLSKKFSLMGKYTPVNPEATGTDREWVCEETTAQTDNNCLSCKVQLSASNVKDDGTAKWVFSVSGQSSARVSSSNEAAEPQDVQVWFASGDFASPQLEVIEIATWGGYERRFENGEWTTVTEITTGLFANGYTPEVGRTYTVDTGAMAILHPAELPGTGGSGNFYECTDVTDVTWSGYKLSWNNDKEELLPAIDVTATGWQGILAGRYAIVDFKAMGGDRAFEKPEPEEPVYKIIIAEGSYLGYGVVTRAIECYITDPDATGNSRVWQSEEDTEIYCNSDGYWELRSTEIPFGCLMRLNAQCDNPWDGNWHNVTGELIEPIYSEEGMEPPTIFFGADMTIEDCREEFFPAVIHWSENRGKWTFRCGVIGKYTYAAGNIGAYATVAEICEDFSGRWTFEDGTHWAVVPGWVREEDIITEMPIVGYTPIVGKVYNVDTTAMGVLYPEAKEQYFKCLSVDVGQAIEPYQDVKISGVTAPADLNGDLIVKDPMTVGTNRMFAKDAFLLGYDTKNSAWCINTGVDKPDSVNSLFYAKIEGISTEDGSLANPIYWDSEGVATSDRTITAEYNTGEAPWGDMGYEGWCFYVRLKAGTEYTIGICVPTGDDYWYDAYLYLKDTKGNTLTTGAQSDSVTIGGKTITFYLKYTPTEDGLFVIQAQEEMNGLITPIACSPAPELSTQPTSDLFAQNWQIGGGVNAGFEVVSAGVAECVQRYAQIEGYGISEESVWQSADGQWYAYLYTGNAYYNEYRWIISKEREYNGSNYYYMSQSVTVESISDMPHPGLAVWNDRNSSSYGDCPKTRIAPAEGVTGTPVLTPIEMPGRESVGYAVWNGQLVEMNKKGVWAESYVTKKGLKAEKTIPIPGEIYNITGDVKIANAYKNVNGILYGAGNEWERYNIVKSKYVLSRANDKTWRQIAVPYNSANFIAAIDTDGYLWTQGYNYYGQLGLGDTNARSEPTKVGSRKWKQVVCGGAGFTVAIDNSGTLYGTGYGINGYYGGSDVYSSFTKLNDKKWQYVACGDYQTLAIDDNGYLWVTGQNNYGQLGTGDTVYPTTFTQIGTKTWKKVVTNRSTTFAIDTDGYLWGTGYNAYGVLGTGDSTNRNTFTKIGNQRWKSVALNLNSAIGVNSEGFMCGINAESRDHRIWTDIKHKWRSVTGVSEMFMMIDEYGRAWWYGRHNSAGVPFNSDVPRLLYGVNGNCTSVVAGYHYCFVIANE